MTAAANFDEKLVNLFGRTPFSLIMGGGAGALTDLIFRIGSYGYDIQDIYDQLDSVVRFLSPSFGNIAFYGALGGVAVGLVVGLITKKIDRPWRRALVGIIAGIITRIGAEIIIRIVKEGDLIYACDFVWLCRNQLLFAGTLVGMFIALIPLAKKPVN
jgi:hypothetical protein